MCSQPNQNSMWCPNEYQHSRMTFIQQWNDMASDVEMSLYHEQFERDVIQPTQTGIYLLALFYLMQNKYRDIRYWLFPCKHKNWVDESYGNPDSGGDGGYCKDCGWSFWHQYY